MYQLPECIKMKEVRALVWEALGGVLAQAGYKGSKSTGEFAKAFGKGKIKFAFYFYNYWPNKQEYQFRFYVFVHEIQSFVQAMCETLQVDPRVSWAVSIPEGNFIKELENEEPKFRYAFVSQVTTEAECREKLRQTALRLEHEAFPLAASIATLEGFQKYYLNNAPLLLQEAFDSQLFLSMLVAAYLKGIDCYRDVAQFLKAALDKEKAAGRNYVPNYRSLDHMEKYIAICQK